MGKKWWIIAAAVIVIAGLIAASFYMRKPEKPLTARPATARVQKGNLAVTVSGTGSIQPAARETITPADKGTVKEIHVQAGDRVKKGDVLISLEGQDLSTQIEAAEINLQKQQLDLSDLQEKLKIATDDSSRENIMLSIKKQLLDIESNKKQIESLKSEEEPEPITAPIDGTLAELSVNVGDDIGPNQAVAEIADYQHLQLVVSIDELDIPQVKIGQEAKISVDALPNQVFSGKVVKIADEGTPSNGVATFDVTLQLAEATGVKAGMSAEASIMLQQKNNVLVLPVEAVHALQNRFFVMLPESNKNGAGNESGEGGSERQSADTGRNGGFGAAGAGNIRPVEVGIHNEDFIEIVSGLREGDTVLLPAVAQTSANNNQQFQGGRPSFGFGGGGGFQRAVNGGGRGPQGGGGRGMNSRNGNGGGGGR
ncbi:MAG TPA: efflux RND transporter periplasmic adaptor subunit [Bacilli bacterium]